MEIVVEVPEDMNLLGLFVATALKERAGALAAAKIEGDIALTAGATGGRIVDRIRKASDRRGDRGTKTSQPPSDRAGGQMEITLSFEPGRATIRRGIVGSPRARVRGSLASLLALARGRTARTVVTGSVRISGNPLAALPLAKVLSATPDARQETRT